MKVSIIIPNFNGQELLKRNIPAVCTAVEFYCKKTKQDVEVVVIDDASTDASVSYLEEQKKTLATYHFEYLVNSKNLGFSPTVNRAVSHAKGEIIVLLNSDVHPEENFLIALLEHFDDISVFGVGCMDKSIENGKVVLRGRGIGKWERGFLVHAAGDVTKTNTLWINGGSGAFRKTLWEKLGGFIELYKPFYWEDIDLSYRALKAGYTIYFEPKSIVIHEHEKGAIKQQFTKSKVLITAYRNQCLFTWINATDVTIVFQHIIWLPVFVLKAFYKQDTAFIQGLWQALCLLPKVWVQRKKDTKDVDKNR
jgi:GT2 family glycosyltransferase